MIFIQVDLRLGLVGLSLAFAVGGWSEAVALAEDTKEIALC